MLSHDATRRKMIPREFGKRALDVAISVPAIVVLTPVFMALRTAWTDLKLIALTFPTVLRGAVPDEVLE